MGELRRDPVVGRWVIVDTEHPRKPEEFKHEQNIISGGLCPFCYGNECMTPPEMRSRNAPKSLVVSCLPG